MKRKIRLKYLLTLATVILQISGLKSERNCSSTKTETAIGRNAFSPRMDFNQWKPLGRGDPLKNDPTYDYVPPVLDQVQYWVEPENRKPDPPLPEDSKKTEILLLGVLSKKTASPPIKADSRRDNFEPFQKKEQKYNPHQRISKPTFSLPSSFFPESIFSSLNKFTSKNEKPITPYTVLMPPPMNLPKGPTLHSSTLIQPSIPINIPELQQTQYTPVTNIYTTAPPTTNSFTGSTSSVTIQPSHLVYHSSSLSDISEWKHKKPYLTSPATINWRPSTIRPYVPTTRKPIPNFNFNENLVFNKHLQPPESFIHIEFNANNYSNTHLIGSDSNYNLNVVTPPSLKKTHKGSISDNSDEIKESYVKIEKPEFYSTGLGSDDIISINTAPLIEIYSHMQHPVSNQEMQTIKKMQTLLPPPTSERPFYKEIASNPILDALMKENRKPINKQPMFLTQTPTFIVPSSTSTITTTSAPTTVEPFYPTLPSETESSIITVYNKDNTITESDKEETSIYSIPTTTPPAISSTTTTVSSTTDSFLKYFKKPEDIHKNPVYFVIQGHSKVKTYGPTKQVHGINVQETNEILDDESAQYKVRHLHGFRKEPNLDNIREGRSGNLQTLKHVVQTGFGQIDFPPEIYKPGEKKDIQEIDLAFGYNVADRDSVPTEVYRKGFVEESRNMKV